MTALLILDTETTGLDPKKDELIEIGAVLYDAAIGAIVESRSLLVGAKSNAAEHINRIPVALLQSGWATTREEAVGCICDMVELGKSQYPDRCYIVAHNVDFDRKWLPELAEETWLCTLRDVEWPRLSLGGPGGSLASLALAYDVGIVRAHRALEDCLTLAAVLSRVYELEGDLQGWLELALEPKVEVIADVSYQRRELAKAAGFSWNGDRKVWWRNVPASKLVEYVKALPFGTRVETGA
jgi:DNA polymerase-3 subunit epsilon